MLLEILNLHAGYGDSEVLHGVSLEVDVGEFVAIVGPNGAGKSTVLKSVMGLATQRGGEVRFAGADVARLPAHARLNAGIGFVPQGRLVFPSMTVRENLEVGGHTLRGRAQIANRLSNVFDHFPVLKNKSKTRAGALSGGEQQMLAIGRALMVSPKLLMLDEPSLGLSPKVTREVFDILARLNAAGVALLVVEQNVRLVLRYASRGYLMAAGAISFSGSAAELGDERRMREAYLA